MDTKTGQIYPNEETAIKDLLSKNVPKEEIKERIITGTMRDLRKMRKKIHKQLRRERK